MSRKQFRALLGLNLALLALLAAVSLAPIAQAQRAERARGQYTMVAGGVQGMEQSAVYVVDASNQEMIAVYWDSGRRGLASLGYRNLSEDAQAPAGVGR